MESLKDRDIQNLLRMAGEINALEAGEFERETGPVFRIHAERADRFRLARAAGLGLLAASVVLAGVVSLKFMAPAPPVVRPGPGIAQRPAEPAKNVQIAKAEPEQGCVVLTVFRDTEGDCKCVQVQTHELASGRLEDLPRAELLKLALKTPCATSAQRVLVLAVSGRADSLPRTREDAEAIARSVEAHDDPAWIASAAMPSLPPDSTVIAETVAWQKPSLAFDAGFPGAPFLR